MAKPCGQNILIGGLARIFFEELSKVINAVVFSFGKLLDGEISMVVFVNKRNDLLNGGRDPFFFAP